MKFIFNRSFGNSTSHRAHKSDMCIAVWSLEFASSFLLHLHLAHLSAIENCKSSPNKCLLKWAHTSPVNIDYIITISNRLRVRFNFSTICLYHFGFILFLWENEVKKLKTVLSNIGRNLIGNSSVIIISFNFNTFIAYFYSQIISRRWCL